MLTKESIERALPFIEESWWLMCDADPKDWDLKFPQANVKAFPNFISVEYVWDNGENKYSKNPDSKKKEMDYHFIIYPNESIRKLVKEVHDALEHIMKEPYDYYLDDDNDN